MRCLLVLGVACLLAACGTTKSEGPPRYRAWCNTDTRYVAPWRDSRAEAESDREEHRKMWGWHAVRIDTAGAASEP